MGTTLIALVRLGHGATAYRKVLYTDDDIFCLPDNLAMSNDYNPGVLHEDDEWFRLANFSTKSYCLPLLKQTSFSSANFDIITNNDFGKIDFLCGYQNGRYFFQRVTPSHQVKKRRIFFGEQCTYEANSTSIPINLYADAIYITTENTLFFRKLRDISAIFDGISELYKEATEEEVRSFLAKDFINLRDGFSSDKVKTNNRKRIALALEPLNRFTKKEKKTVFEYIKDYCPELVTENNKFHIHDEDSLKKLLWGIAQRYYTTPVGKERRIANSIITLN